jgi:hypothetical protein
VDERLIRFLTAAGQAAQARKQARVDAYGDELLGVGGLWTADAPRPLQLLIG